MFVDIIKYLVFFLGFGLLLLVEHTLGLPVWSFFWLWQVARRRHRLPELLAWWVFSAVLVSVVYQLSLTVGFVLCLMPLSYAYHQPWWRSQTLGMLVSIVVPVLAIAVWSQTPWAWGVSLYLLISWMAMVILVKTWLMDRMTLGKDRLTVEWRWLERLRTD